MQQGGKHGGIKANRKKIPRIMEKMPKKKKVKFKA